MKPQMNADQPKLHGQFLFLSALIGGCSHGFQAKGHAPA
jgi:hypothetical protein